MKCAECGARLAPRNTFLNEACDLTCGECYLRTASAAEIANVLDAIAIETQIEFLDSLGEEG
jgi:hypothetical protein